MPVPHPAELAIFNALQRRDGQDIELPSKCRLVVEEGDRLTLETPGGGGWGRA